MIGWAWSGTALTAAGCGLSSEYDQALQSAEKWLRQNPQGTVLLGQVHPSHGSDIVAALRSPRGNRLVSERRDGQVTWREASALELAAAS
jgi:hypothetical protein